MTNYIELIILDQFTPNFQKPNKLFFKNRKNIIILFKKNIV